MGNYGEFFYGVYGTNGLGVFDNWDSCKRELVVWAGGHSNCKKYDNYEDACAFAIGMYKSVMRRYVHKVRVKAPDELPINFFILTRTMAITDNGK